MTDFFLFLVNRSISACWLVLAVLVIRLVFKQAPKWLDPFLWGLVGLRLVLPSVSSALSLLPRKAPIKAPAFAAGVPAFQGGNAVLNGPVNAGPVSPAVHQVSRITGIVQAVTGGLTLVWAVGAAALLVYSAVSYLRLSRQVDTAVCLRDNIYQSEKVQTPFVMGICKPRIYLSYKIEAKDAEFIIAHEEAHIRRKDHWWKPLGFLILTVYWFNPVLWLAYGLFCRDVELACDEKAVKGFDKARRADYSQALLNCSAPRKSVAACPLAFGEVSVKQRVKQVLNYKKPAFWLVLLAVAAAVCAAVFFATEPVSHVFDFEADPIKEAEVFDYRLDSGNRKAVLNQSQLDELESRLTALEKPFKMRKSDAGAVNLKGVGAEMRITLQSGETIRIDGWQDGWMYIQCSRYPGEMRQTKDKEFSAYLDNAAAGGDVIKAEQEEQPVDTEDAAPAYHPGDIVAVTPLYEGEYSLRLIHTRVEQPQQESPAAGKRLGGFELEVYRDDKMISCMGEGELSNLFQNGPELAFDARLKLEVDDYNRDGCPDFALGQFVTSSVMEYRLFTVDKDGNLRRLLADGEILASGLDYAPRFEKIEEGENKNGFLFCRGENPDSWDAAHWDGKQFHVTPDAVVIPSQQNSDSSAKQLCESWLAFWNQELKPQIGGMLNGDGTAFGADLTGDGQDEIIILYDNYKTAGAVLWQLGENGPICLGSFEAPSFYEEGENEYELYKTQNGNLLHTFVPMRGGAADSRVWVNEEFVYFNEEGRLQTQELMFCLDTNTGKAVYYSSAQAGTAIPREKYEEKRQEFLQGAELLEVIRQKPEKDCSFEEDPAAFEEFLNQVLNKTSEASQSYPANEKPSVPAVNRLEPAE